jgi:hypothetical protein
MILAIEKLAVVITKIKKKIIDFILFLKLFLNKIV